MQIKVQSFLKRIVVFPVILLTLNGCGVWENFTTYFNLYYNAKDTFQQAEESIQAQKTDVFDLGDPVLPGNARQLLVKVTEKCSKILQFHNESGYVDDALLMIGKSFYYQANYQKALRKFNELLATHPNSDLVLETNLWIGKTEMRLKSYDKGLATLDQVKKEALKEDENQFVREAYIEEIKYKLLQEDNEGAISLCNDFLKVSDDDQLNADVQYEVGLLYQKIDDTKNAIAAFQKVNDYSPTFDTKFDAMLQLGEALRDNNQSEKAEEIFQDLRDEAKYSDRYDKIELQSGLTKKSLGDYNQAVGILRMVDTAYSSTPSAGTARYYLANIYENNLLKFDSAKAYYAKTISSAVPADLMKDARQKNELFIKYDNLSKDLQSYNKQLEYLGDSTLFISDSIAFLKADSLKKLNNEQDKLVDRRIAGKSQTQQNNNAIAPPKRPTLSVDSLNVLIVKDEFELGNIFLTELNVPDSSYYYYNDILSNYPNSAYQARTLYALGSYYSTQNNEQKADSLFNIIYNNYKHESIVNAAANKLNKPLIDLNYDPAKKLYSSAEEDFNSSKYDTSLSEFKNIVIQHPTSPFAAKSMYAIGWILENKLSLPDSAATVYDSLVAHYPNTVYATTVLPELNFYKQEQARIKKAIQDSIYALNHPKDSLSVDSTKSAVKETITSGENNLKTKQGNKQESPNKITDKQAQSVRAEDILKEKLRRDNKANPANPDTLIRGNYRGSTNRKR